MSGNASLRVSVEPQPSIVIVDDDAFVRGVLACIAEQAGLKPVDASEHLAITDAELKAADFIVLDLVMPETDGIQWLRRLAKLGVTGQVMVVSGASHRLLRHALATARGYGLNVAGAISKFGNFADFREIISGSVRAPKAISTGARDSAVPTVDEIAVGMQNREFQVVLQPKVRLSDGLWVGNEAMARWRSPTLGFVMPDTFIPVVEDSHLAAEFTLHMIDLALDATRKLSASGRFRGSVSVNVSPSALQFVSLTESILSLLGHYQINPRQLTLEITERQALIEGAVPLDVQSRLALRGLKLSVDDFGVGQASMERLNDALFDELKIDKSFITDVSTDRQLRIVAESMINLAHKLDMSVVAEGIEDASTARLMAGLGCNEGQGYFFSRPMSAEDLLESFEIPQWRV